jgi:hypothetical protein
MIRQVAVINVELVYVLLGWNYPFAAVNEAHTQRHQNVTLSFCHHFDYKFESVT